MRISDWSSDVCSSDLPEGVVGVHHCSFTYATLADLMSTYERLRDKGIRPVFPINHGPTTSMYYADPDGNQIELQVDNYDQIEEDRKSTRLNSSHYCAYGMPYYAL